MIFVEIQYESGPDRVDGEKDYRGRYRTEQRGPKGRRRMTPRE